MSLHFHPIAFGVMLVVAAGTLVYTLWNRPNTHRPHGSDRSYSDFDFDERSSAFSSVPDDDEERPPKRKRNSDRCSICLGALKYSLKALTCTHIFHEHCIRTWLTDNKTCPICRKEAA